MSHQHDPLADGEVRRQRLLARSLALRIFITPSGRLLLVGGKPDGRKLMDRLTKLGASPRARDVTSPLDLGFDAISDGELSEHGLLVRMRALARWESAVLAAARLRRRSKSLRRRIASEAGQILELRRRCEELLAVVRARPSAVDASPQWLASFEEARLAGTLAEVPELAAISDGARAVAHTIAWIAGRNAMRDYLLCLAPLAGAVARQELVRRLERFQKQLQVWKNRSLVEDDGMLWWELKQAVSELPAGLHRQGIDWNPRGLQFQRL
jgi:hypothetical protein